MNYQRTILTVTGQVLGMLSFAAMLLLIIAIGTILLD
jgi:hypothetical protein